jgi:hypothetical protein
MLCGIEEGLEGACASVAVFGVDVFVSLSCVLRGRFHIS